MISGSGGVKIGSGFDDLKFADGEEEFDSSLDLDIISTVNPSTVITRTFGLDMVIRFKGLVGPLQDILKTVGLG